MVASRFCIAVFLLTSGSVTASAQDVLDRTDPTQEEEVEERVEKQAENPSLELPQNVDTQSDVQSEVIEARAILLSGLRAMPADEFSDIIAAYAGRRLTNQDLQQLLEAIALRARSQGYIFANAQIRPQALANGVLRVTVDEGVIDEISVQGDDSPAIRSQLRPLIGDEPVTLERLEHHILLAEDLAGVRMRDPRYENIDGKGVLTVEAAHDPFDARIDLENDGSQPIGPLRARIDLDFNGLLSSFDELDLIYATVPDAPEELQYVLGRYSAIVDDFGTEVSITGSYSQTEPGAFLADRDIFGRSTRVALQLRHPVRRSRTFSAWIDGEFEIRDLRQDRADVIARHDRVVALRSGLYMKGDLFGGDIRSRITVSQGVDILNATDEGDPLASREDAPPDFTTLHGWFDWERSLSKSFELAIGGRGQLSSTPLLITEDLGLGGNQFLRGYDFNERTGDFGVMGFAELRFDLDEPLGVARQLQAYTFIDGGVVDNLEGGRGSGSLASSGGGFRVEVTRDLDFQMELAFPLTGPRFDTDDKSPRFNFGISHSF